MTDPAYDYDLFVIGAGSGGVRASRIAAGYGARVAVAEEYRVGGTCVIRGCVPKKLLVYGSHFAEELQDAANYGWTVEMQIKAARRGLRYREVPAAYRRRLGTSKVSGTIRGVLGASYKILGLLAWYDLLGDRR